MSHTVLFDLPLNLHDTVSIIQIWDGMKIDETITRTKYMKMTIMKMFTINVEG